MTKIKSIIAWTLVRWVNRLDPTVLPLIVYTNSQLVKILDDAVAEVQAAINAGADPSDALTEAAKRVVH